jgi:hypothetical protein
VSIVPRTRLPGEGSAKGVKVAGGVDGSGVSKVLKFVCKELFDGGLAFLRE